MPVTSEGDQTMTAVDQSGNAASTSFYTEYGIGNLRDQNADLARQLEEIRQLLALEWRHADSVRLPRVGQP